MNGKHRYTVGVVGVSDDGSRVTYATGGTITALSVGTGERITVLDRSRAPGMTALDRAGRSALVVREGGTSRPGSTYGRCAATPIR